MDALRVLSVLRPHLQPLEGLLRGGVEHLPGQAQSQVSSAATKRSARRLTLQPAVSRTGPAALPPVSPAASGVLVTRSLVTHVTHARHSSRHSLITRHTRHTITRHARAAKRLMSQNDYTASGASQPTEICLSSPSRSCKPCRSPPPAHLSVLVQPRGPLVLNNGRVHVHIGPVEHNGLRTHAHACASAAASRAGLRAAQQGIGCAGPPGTNTTRTHKHSVCAVLGRPARPWLFRARRSAALGPRRAAHLGKRPHAGASQQPYPQSGRHAPSAGQRCSATARAARRRGRLVRLPSPRRCRRRRPLWP
jgi:hypothetical protein